MSRACDFCGKKDDSHKEEEGEVFVSSNTLTMGASLDNYGGELKFDTCDSCGDNLVNDIMNKIKEQTKC